MPNRHNVEYKQNLIHDFNAAGSRPSTAKQGYQQEYQLARIHIAEQPHTVGYGFRKKLDQVQQKVRRCEFAPNGALNNS